MAECSYGSCTNAAEAVIRWQPSGVEREYCLEHANGALVDFPDMTEKVEGVQHG